MLFDSIKRNGIAIVSCTIFIVALLWCVNLLLEPNTAIFSEPTDTMMPLKQLLIKWFYGSTWFAITAGACMVLLLAMLLYRLNERHLFILKREPLLAILFALMLSAFKDTHYLLSMHFALLLNILSFNAVFYTYRRDYAFREVFMSALYLSVATLFYAPAIYFLLALIICLSLMKPVLWRDWAVVIAGLVTPYIFALFYYFFAKGDWQIPFSLLIDNLSIEIPKSIPVFSVPEWIFLIYITLILLFSILRLLFVPNIGAKVKAIRINIAFAWLFIVSLFCCIFYPMGESNENLIIVSMPATVLMLSFFGPIKKNALGNFLLILLLLSVVAMQIPDNWYVWVGEVFTNLWEFVLSLF